MARGGLGAKRKRTSKQQGEEVPAEDVGSEYNLSEDSDRESQEETLGALVSELRSTGKASDKGKATARDKGNVAEKAKASDKGKASAKDKGKIAEKAKACDKGKTPVQAKSKGKGGAKGSGKGGKRSGGVTIREPGGGSPPHASGPVIDSKRRQMYSSKRCVGERHVGVANLFEKVPGFQEIFEHGDLHEICNFSERTGYALELIREFYMFAGNVVETEGGPYSFTTVVREVEVTVTPDVIALVLEMEAQIDGVDYMHSGFESVRDWKTVLTALCVPNPENYGTAVLSKDLKIEYRFLNFIVCYNIMPLANTKVIRWDRLLYMYLLGRPDIVQDRNINLNVPFLVWKRMAREVKTASQKDRLPFPMLIMRILRLKGVNVLCSTIEYSLGHISDTTIAKSHIQLHPHSPPTASAPPSAPSRAQAASSSATASVPDVSVSDLHREQQRLSGEIERLVSNHAELLRVQTKLEEDVARMNRRSGRVSTLLRLLCTKMGCTSSELPDSDTDSDEDTE